MGTKRDGLAGLSFLQALKPQDLATGGAQISGNTIDLRGYNECVFAIQFCDFTGADSFGATEYWQVGMQHGLASAAGVSAWSDVGIENVLHSVMGSGGSVSACTSGFVFSVHSADVSGAVLVMGYRGDNTHRYVRLKISEVLAPSICSAAAQCILGRPSQWPVVAAAGN